MKTFKTLLIALSLVACGDDLASDSLPEPARDAPQAVPDRGVVCLNQLPFPVVNQTRTFGLIVTNQGAEDLLVGDARLVMDTRDNYRVTGVRAEDGRLCTTGSECRLGFNDTAAIGLELTPDSRGWDWGLVEIDTNDPDRSNEELRVAVFSAARDPSDDETMAIDFGDRPEGSECFCVFPIPEQCQE